MRTHWLIVAIVSFVELCNSHPVWAGGPAGQGDFYVDTRFALTTSKSKMLGSNDTGTALRYGVGAFVGNEGSLAFLLDIDADSTTFALNDSKLAMNWRDTKVRYHLGIFYIGALFTQLEMKATKEGAEIIDGAGSGNGLTTGIIFNVGKSSLVYFDVATASIAEVKNTLEQTTQIKQRLDVDIGASLPITQKMLDMTLGYRYRSTTLVTDASYTEVLTATYLGLRFSLDL